MQSSGGPQKRAKAISGSVTVRPTKAGAPVLYGLWRDSTRTFMNRRIGDAWLEPIEVRNPFVEGDDRPEPLPKGARGAESWRDKWRERKGRAPDGYITARKFGSGLDDLILAREMEIDQLAVEDIRRAASPTGDVLRFEDAADAWLAHRISVGGIKATTERNYRAMLRRTDAQPLKRGSAPRALVMVTFGGRPIHEITERNIKDFLRKLDDDPKLSARSVNAYRQLLAGIFKFAVGEGWIDSNPVAATEKRREPDPPPLVTYSPEEVWAIARVLASGQHRNVEKIKLGPDELKVRAEEDRTDAALVITAAFTGLRQGELFALQWGEVGFDSGRILVQRNYVMGEATSPKGRRSRSVPMSAQVAEQLSRLAKRDHGTGRSDLVFQSRLGGHIDASAFRRRYTAARDLAIKANPDMPALRFHDLRHTFGTLAASGFDLVNVQAMLGHADLKTTGRYLHARPASDDAARLSDIFAGEELGELEAGVEAS